MSKRCHVYPLQLLQRVLLCDAGCRMGRYVIDARHVQPVGLAILLLFALYRWLRVRELTVARHRCSLQTVLVRILSSVSRLQACFA